jgi:hypothetical protein
MSDNGKDARVCMKCGQSEAWPRWCHYGQAHQFFPPLNSATSSDDAFREASSLAMSLWKKHYKEASPNFELLSTTAGIISQIDNMVSGLTASSATSSGEEFIRAVNGPQATSSDVTIDNSHLPLDEQLRFTADGIAMGGELHPADSNDIMRMCYAALAALEQGK